MALELRHQYGTFSRNVVLRDTALETFRGEDVRSCGGVEFDVHLMVNGSLDLRVGGFSGIITVLKHDSYLSGILCILGEWVIRWTEVDFQYVIDPSRFDATLDESWDNLALDVVEWLLRVEGRGESPVSCSPEVVRKSRYGREPVI